MSDLRITTIRARAVNVPLTYPVRTAVGVVDTSPLVLFDMETNQGVTGRAYVFTYTPLGLKPVRELLNALQPVLAGQEVAPYCLEQLLQARFRLLGNTGVAKIASAAIDMAAWDALAQSRGAPLVNLLGGTRKPIPAYDSHSMDGPKIGPQRAEKAIKEGLRAIKIKIGHATVREDIASVALIRKVIGDDIELMVDLNQSLSVPEAIRRGRALEEFRLAWLEEPTLQENYAGFSQIRQALTTPIQLGENWFSVDEMHKAIVAGAADLVMPDAMKIGGVSGWLRASALAATYQIPMSAHIFEEFSAHLMAVTPTAHWLEKMGLADPILREPLTYVDGMAIIPERPGVGITWNEEAVQKYLI
ncbi:enolase C-terminal domain-like protein [Eoetvoesiella caeni]|uniref:Mandelate racemase n=1 Tax=Eoetvoesiella caeni TaxID=645616 RepID=A0A366HLZ2_9BURK|nr:enolase C-terminal domain-like protein [Eoetvoesiella caeni]MCI2806995.1 mandelate racemase [Eoetvoesiella caeni]NYT53609.1 mandelate racemase [Eoetvoesiella caeni]RBP43597.1 mandelate racemase [Eoetvoesiella caeni]